MAEQNIPIKRGGKEHVAEVGITSDGNSRLNIQDTAPDNTHNQPVKKAPIRLVIEFNEGEMNGEVTGIYTTWKETMLSNAGLPIHSTGKTLPMTTNKVDISAFVQMFGGPILMSMLNGFVRDVMGFNDKPVFNAQGQVIQYTEEQGNEPPTNDYRAITPTEPTE